MTQVPPRDLRALGARFRILGTQVAVAPYGSGHINETYAATYDQAGTPVRYIHQRVNGHVFREPERLMDNVARVLAHAARRVAGLPDASRRALTLVPAHDGRPFVVDLGVPSQLPHVAEALRRHGSHLSELSAAVATHGHADRDPNRDGHQYAAADCHAD